MAENDQQTFFPRGCAVVAVLFLVIPLLFVAWAFLNIFNNQPDDTFNATTDEESVDLPSDNAITDEESVDLPSDDAITDEESVDLPSDDAITDEESVDLPSEELESSSENPPWFIDPTVRIPTERPRGTFDSDAVDFDDMPTPTLEARLADLGDDRLREIEFFLPEGDGPIEFAIRNPQPIRIDGQGIALRTGDFAQSLRSSQSFSMDRPLECFDGNCRLFMWLTMGPTFLDVNPEAELLIWAGEGAAVTIENMPVENFRDETFR